MLSILASFMYLLEFFLCSVLLRCSSFTCSNKPRLSVASDLVRSILASHRSVPKPKLLWKVKVFGSGFCRNLLMNTCKKLTESKNQDFLNVFCGHYRKRILSKIVVIIRIELKFVLEPEKRMQIVGKLFGLGSLI